MQNGSQPEMECLRCGSCCHVDMFAYITPDDIRRWEREGRHDILEHMRDHGITWAGDIIVSSAGTRLKSCAFLNWDGASFSCSIYTTRPAVCRDYAPGSSELCPLHHSRIE